MLSERSKLILDLLLDNHYINLEEVASFFGVSQRTIKNSLLEIDSFLVEKGFQNLKKETIIRYSIDDNDNELDKLSQETQEAQNAYFWEEPRFRQAFLYHTLFWKKNRITIELLEKNLFVSRSTINSDLKMLKQDLKKWNLDIHFQKKEGFYIVGKELEQREAYFYYIHNLNNALEIGVNQDEEEFLKYWLTKVEEKLKITLTYSSFKSIILKVKIIIERIIAGNTLELSSLKNSKSKFLKKGGHDFHSECSILANYFNLEFSIDESEFILEQIQKSTILKNDIVSEGYELSLDIFVNSLLANISELLKIDLTCDKELYDQLAVHFQSTLNNEYMEITDLIAGETLSKIRSMYPQIYTVIRQSMKNNLSGELIGLNTEQEYSFITLHVASSIEKLKNQLELN